MYDKFRGILQIFRGIQEFPDLFSEIFREIFSPWYKHETANSIAPESL